MPPFTAPQGYKHQANATAIPVLAAEIKLFMRLVCWKLSTSNVPVGSMVHGFAEEILGVVGPPPLRLPVSVRDVSLADG